MTSIPESWSGLAFNQVPDSANKIHGDEIAKQYGFKGGLVPGVTLSAYLAQPAIVAWGEEWLAHGFAHVKVIAPVYDGEQFDVQVIPDNHLYSAKLYSRDKLCAEAEISLTQNMPLAPQPRQCEFIDDDYQKPPATREVMEEFLNNGCPAMRFNWHGDHEMTTYFANRAAMPLLLQTDPSVENAQGKANMGFLLGCANRHFAAVASMSPWVHLETKSQNFQAVNLNTQLICEMELLDLFNKKGHEFADCEFNLFEEATGHCVCSIWQRAIYQMRSA